MESGKEGGPPTYDASAPPQAPGYSDQQQYPPTNAPYPQQAPAPYPTTAPPEYPVKGHGQGYPPQGAPPGYPPQGAPPGYPPQGAPPGYPPQGAPPGYPPQGAPPGYPQQAAPPGYPYAGAPPGYPPQGASAGYTTQGVPIQYQGTSNQTTIITQQPAGLTMIAQVPPQDHLALSIVSMFCCFFIGIFAVMNSIKSRDRFRVGDSAGALHFGLSAKRLSVSAIVFAISFYVTLVILRVAIPVIRG